VYCYTFEANDGNSPTRVSNQRYYYRTQQLEQVTEIKDFFRKTRRNRRIAPYRSTWEKSFLKMKVTSLRDGESCLQRDQSYVVGGVYIRGSMELRASVRLRFGVLPSVGHPFLALLLSALCYTDKHTCDSRSRASLPDAPPSFSRSGHIPLMHALAARR